MAFPLAGTGGRLQLWLGFGTHSCHRVPELVINRAVQ
jgi:hypothetical protein